ncbi:FPL domain-containing protein [Entamoeba marina]
MNANETLSHHDHQCLDVLNSVDNTLSDLKLNNIDDLNKLLEILTIFRELFAVYNDQHKLIFNHLERVVDLFMENNVSLNSISNFISILLEITQASSRVLSTPARVWKLISKIFEAHYLQPNFQQEIETIAPTVFHVILSGVLDNFSNINEHTSQHIEVILNHLTSYDTQSNYSYQKLFEFTIKLLPPVLPLLPSLLDLLDSYLNGNHITRLFVSRILHFIISLLPLNSRPLVLERLSNDKTFLLTLLLTDPSNDIPLSSIYIQNIQYLPGSTDLVRFLRTTHSVPKLTSSINTFQSLSLTRLLCPAVIEIIPKDNLETVSNTLRNSPSYINSFALSLIFNNLSTKTQNSIIKNVDNTIISSPFIKNVNLEGIQKILSGFKEGDNEEFLWLITFLNFAFHDDPQTIKEVSGVIRLKFVDFLKQEEFIIVPMTTKCVEQSIKGSILVKDLQQIIENVREQIKLKGDAINEWNNLMKKMNNWIL